MAPNVQSDNKIKIRLLEKEGLSQCQNADSNGAEITSSGSAFPILWSRNAEGPTTDRRQSERRHHQATGASRV